MFEFCFTTAGVIAGKEQVYRPSFFTGFSFNYNITPATRGNNQTTAMLPTP
ncbi:hypothetical protein ES703_55342 [subsurface metagenome]